MVADFTAGTCLPLSEVLQRFEEGVLFGIEVAPVATDGTLSELNDKIIVDLTEDLVQTAAAPEPPKVTGRKQTERKINDYGKLRSLRSAGWNIKNIAVEFGCSEQTVRNVMKQEGIE